MVGYQVVTSAVRKEAAKWDELAAEVAPAHSAVQGLNLEALAFCVFDPISLATLSLGLPTPPEELRRSYEEVRVMVEKLLGGAVTEFSEIGDALVKVATEYERAENVAELDLNRIYSKQG